jgi:hypothetical protein
MADVYLSMWRTCKLYYTCGIIIKITTPTADVVRKERPKQDVVI